MIAFNVNAKGLQAYLSYATFLSPADGSYIETYLSVVGNSVKFIKNENGKFQATVQIMMVFKQNNIIKKFKKTDLFSPEIDDTNKIDITFMDQQRFTLSNGDYDMEIQILDKNKTDAVPFKTTESMTLNINSKNICISGIELVQSYKASVSSNILTKSGYDLVPFTLGFYPASINNLTFYAEIYNTDSIYKADDKFLVTYYIESFETKKTITNYFKFKKETPKKVIVVFNEFDITDLPSGNYNLIIEIKNKDNQSVTIKKLFFQRSNPSVAINLSDVTAVDIINTFAERFKSKDTLADYIKSTFPISTDIEKEFAQNLIEKLYIKMMQQYFYSFWLKRNSIDPEKSWMEYRHEVAKVNKNYGTPIKKGYETDRGRVYLQYGEPNVITEIVSDPSAYPYEIWQYYTLLNQKNRKFVFYQPDLVTNDYELIYSNANGEELVDPIWAAKLMTRDTPTYSTDQPKPDSYWGGKFDDYFNNPR